MSDDTNSRPTKHRSWFARMSDLISREPKDREQLMEVLRDAEERELLSAEACCKYLKCKCAKS
jgi:magnesium and cobalt transporter